MISVAQSDKPSSHVRQRAKKMKVRTLSPFSYLVIPEPGKVPRIVHFDLCQETSVVRIECYNRETGEGCEANTYSRLCSHVHAAIVRLLANAKRGNKIEAEDANRKQQVEEYAQRIVNETEQPDLKGMTK